MSKGRTFEAEVLKVVDALSVHQLDVLVDGATVVLAQVAFRRNVVILGRAANESSLQKKKKKNESFHTPFQETFRVTLNIRP